MSPDLDELLIWGVDEHGIPHHDVVSQEEGFPFAAKLDIMANRVVIGSPDEATLFGVDRATAEEALRRLAPQYGLVFSNRFFAKRHEDRQPVRIDPEGPQAVRAVVRGVPVKASPGQRTPVERHAAEGPVGPVVNEVERHPPIIAEKVRTCPTCGDALQGEHGTFCPRCQWSEHNPNLDGDPRDNPPDPFEDLNKGIIPRVAASHRWAGKWFEAAS